MSIIAPTVVSLITVLVTFIGGWLVSNRITDHWDQVKQNRDLNVAVAHDFQRLYGELIAIWKTWNAVNGGHTAAFSTPSSSQP